VVVVFRVKSEEEKTMAGTKASGEHTAQVEDCLFIIRIPVDHYEILSSVEEGERRLHWLDAREADERVKVILLMNEPGAYGESTYRRYHDDMLKKISENRKGRDGTADHQKGVREMHLLQRFILKRIKSSKLYIDCLQGEVISPFIGASLAADMRFATEETRFVFSHLRKGPYVDGGLPFFLQRYVGHSRALQILLSRGEMDSEEAKSLGLVDRILPVHGFEEACIQAARKLCTYEAEDLAIMKRMFYHFSDELERVFMLESSMVE
jgi:enoyl-CoA hydratase/carnithine racemase